MSKKPTESARPRKIVASRGPHCVCRDADSGVSVAITRAVLDSSRKLGTSIVSPQAQETESPAWFDSTGTLRPQRHVSRYFFFISARNTFRLIEWPGKQCMFAEHDESLYSGTPEP